MKIFGIYLIIHTVLGFIASWVYLIREYKEEKKIVSDDIVIAFILLLIGPIGFVMEVVDCVGAWLKKNKPVQHFLDCIAKLVENVVEKFTKGKKDVVD